MGSIGIITCEVLELEFAYLLANDTDVSGITVVDNEFSRGLTEALLHRTGSPPQLVSHVKYYHSPAGAGPSVLVQVMEVGLHSVIKKLRASVLDAGLEMASHVDAIVIGYGLCGNALKDPETLLSGAAVPIFIPMDEDHPVDDCVGMIIGGRENYYAEQCKQAGTMFMNSGFSRHWKKILSKAYGGKYDLEISRRLFAGYRRSLVLPTPVLSEEELVNNIVEFNETHGLDTEVRQGTLHMLQRTWDQVKAYLLRAESSADMA